MSQQIHRDKKMITIFVVEDDDMDFKQLEALLEEKYRIELEIEKVTFAVELFCSKSPCLNMFSINAMRMSGCI